ncbi:MAG: RNA polymerase sigma factor [Dehalococcoidia bacterium]
MTTLAVPFPTVGTRETDPGLTHLRAMAQGDSGALEALYHLYGGRVLSYLRGQLADEGMAEEVLQDVFLAAWHASAAFRGESKVLTWLLTIAHNRAINARRRRRAPIVALEPRLAGTADSAAGVGGRLDMEHALSRLPDVQRAALELVFYHGLSVVEAAAVLDVPEGTVKSRLHRAKAALRRYLDGDERHA